MAEKKLKYREVPQALAYVIRTIWGISPGYVLSTFFKVIKDRATPYATLFITAAITTQLPLVVNDRGRFRTIASLLLLGFAIELISRLIDLAMGRFIMRAEMKVTIIMREHFYRKYASLPYHLYEDKNVIDAYNYAEQFMYRFNRFGLNQIIGSLGNIIEFIGATVALVAVAWYMPLLLLVFIPFLVRSVFKINRENARTYKENLPAQRRLWTIERMFYPRYIKETRLYGVVDHFLKEGRTLSESMNIRDQAISFKRDKLNFIQESELQIAGLVATVIAVWRIAFQGSPLGIFVLAQQLTGRAGSAIDRLFSDVSQFDEDLYGFSEYRYITEELQSKTPSHELLQVVSGPDLSLRNMSFTYPEAKTPSLRNITLDIPFGSSLAIVGENGAGKTTLTRLLLGLYRPTKGDMLIDDKPLTEYDETSWLRRTGVLLQDFGLNEDITIRDMVQIGDIDHAGDDDKVWDALSRAEMFKTIDELPYKLNTYLGKWVDEEKGTELSGGQLQRLAIARTLFRDPDVLILDEPTSAVDANAEERIFRHLQEVRKNKTTIFISHRFSTVRRAQQIIFIDKGRIAERGSHDELMKQQGKYYQMFMAQAKSYL